MLKNKNFVASRAFAHHQPGEIVTAKVLNPIESRGSIGKARPVVLLRRMGACWLVMGLTTLPSFANGAPRVAVPNPAACGLTTQGYLWGMPTKVCALDIGHHLGFSDPALRSILAPFNNEE